MLDKFMANKSPISMFLFKKSDVCDEKYKNTLILHGDNRSHLMIRLQKSVRINIINYKIKKNYKNYKLTKIYFFKTIFAACAIAWYSRGKKK